MVPYCRPVGIFPEPFPTAVGAVDPMECSVSSLAIGPNSVGLRRVSG